MPGGAPVGNRNRRKDKLLEAAFRRELTQNPEDAKLIAQAIINKCKAGDIAAVALLRDTVDGKPKEHVQLEATITRRLSYAERLAKERAQTARATSAGTVGNTVQ